MNITYEIDDSGNDRQLKIFINGTLHLWLNQRAVFGMYSYIENGVYFINVAMSVGTFITLKYSTKEKWEEILNIINSQL